MWNSPQIKESSAKFKVSINNIVCCWINSTTVLGGGVHINKHQGSDLVILHCPFPIRADGSFCPFPHTIIVQFHFKGLWDLLVLPKAMLTAATAWVSWDSFFNRNKLLSSGASSHWGWLSAPAFPTSIHFFLSVSGGTGPESCSKKTWCLWNTVHCLLRSRGKCKGQKIKQKGKIFCKIREKGVMKAWCSGFKKRKKPQKNLEALANFTTIEEETENTKMTLKRKAAKQCHGVSLLHSTFLSV